MDLSKVSFPCFVLDVTCFSCEDFVTPCRLSGLIFDSLYSCVRVVESNLFNHSFSVEIHKVNTVEDLKYVLKDVLCDSYDDVVGDSVDMGDKELQLNILHI